MRIHIEDRREDIATFGAEVRKEKIPPLNAPTSIRCVVFDNIFVRLDEVLSVNDRLMESISSLRCHPKIGHIVFVRRGRGQSLVIRPSIRIRFRECTVNLERFSRFFWASLLDFLSKCPRWQSNSRDSQFQSAQLAPGENPHPNLFQFVEDSTLGITFVTLKLQLA